MDVRMIAHDMRAPLNALSLAIENARRATAPSDINRSLEIAARNAKALSLIIDSIIETSTSRAGHLHLHECLPLDLVTNAIDQVAPLAEEKGLRVDTGELIALPPIIVDGIRITRVLVNLLSNAVRFSPSGGRVHMDARPRLNDGHSVTVFSVSDEGPGVSPENIDRIFVEGVSLGKPSSGLGLAVCKEIVEAHGGRIWVETGHTAGATFAFSIPNMLQAS